MSKKCSDTDFPDAKQKMIEKDTTNAGQEAIADPCLSRAFLLYRAEGRMYTVPVMVQAKVHQVCILLVMKLYSRL